MEILTPEEQEKQIEAPLAVDGGKPICSPPLPYSRQTVLEVDIDAVTAVLRSPWLTTGPKVVEFESAFAKLVNASHAVSVNSGTAALHAAVFAAGVGPGDEVIVPAITFAASANAVIYQGGTPVFCDVEPDTLLLSTDQVVRLITPKTKAILAVDYAGQPCDYSELKRIGEKHNLALISDACHSLGSTYRNQSTGSIADLTAFSFHPVKHITTGEGGMVSTSSPIFEKRMKTFRNHGLDSDPKEREEKGTWYYEMRDLGFNYRMPDIQAALGLSQLQHLLDWVKIRQTLATHYNQLLREEAWIQPLALKKDRTHSYHLYVVRIDFSKLGTNRAEFFKALRAEGVGVNVHYIPVYRHPYYQKHLQDKIVDCPNAELCYEQILSLPIFPAMRLSDVEKVVRALKKLHHFFARRGAAQGNTPRRFSNENQ